MSEARQANKTERAIVEFEEYKNMGYGQAYRPSSEAIETALSALRAQEQNEPLTCEGCKLHKLPHHPALRIAQCSCCSREGRRTDNYEPKGAHQ